VDVEPPGGRMSGPSSGIQLKFPARIALSKEESSAIMLFSCADLDSVRSTTQRTLQMSSPYGRGFPQISILVQSSPRSSLKASRIDQRFLVRTHFLVAV